MQIDFEKIYALLTDPIKPVGNYVFIKQAGDLIFTSGIIPLKNGVLIHKGKLGATISLDQGQECAKQCVLNVLSLLKENLGGSLISFREVISIRAIVASTAEYTEHAKIANGASDFLVELFGDAGKHTRAAFGVPSLPLDAPVEIEFVFRVDK
jgi:enamine deaminase RidA (YjgF/YER057c/UK114 family)